ncbi:MAG TPA: hypothetical protein GX711_09215 [Clostridia bacterium]|nr:hypothetical protein [Clostridia bacterium]
MTKVSPLSYWTPRILAIVFIIFLMLFSLDVISPELTFGEIFVGLFIHNIPALVLIIVLIISWKHEIVGGVVFLLTGLLFMIIIAPSELGGLIIAGPALLIGGLFMINWFKKKQ